MDKQTAEMIAKLSDVVHSQHQEIIRLTRENRSLSNECRDLREIIITKKAQEGVTHG